MSDENQVKEESETGYSMEDVLKYVKQWFQYEEEKRLISEAQRDWSKEFMQDHPSIPKKELTAALSAFKKKLDIDIVAEMFDEISSLVGIDEE